MLLWRLAPKREPLFALRHRVRVGAGLSHRSSCRLEHGALGNDALGDITPQGDEEFAGQRDDGDPADASLRGADPRMKPEAQRRVRLVTQPEPGKLNHRLAQAAIS